MTKILLRARGLLCGLLAVLCISPLWADTYTLVTDVSQVMTGDKVIVATNVNDAPSTGVTGWNGTKDATVSETEADWIQYEVTAVQDGWNLYDSKAEKYIKSPGNTNQFLYHATDKGTCSVNENGVLMCNSRYLVKNNNYYRMYTAILVKNNNYYRMYTAIQNSYTPFYVWKVTSSDPQETAVLESIVVDGGLDEKTYETTDQLNLTGLTVTGYYSVGDPQTISSGISWKVRTSEAVNDAVALDAYVLTAGQTSVDVQATVDEITSAWVTISGLTVTEHVVTPGEHTINLNNDLYGVTAATNLSTVPVSATVNDITVTTGGSGNKARPETNCIRYYTNNTLTFSVPSGYVIKSIVFAEPTSGSQWDGSITVNNGTYTNDTKSWAGNSNSVTFSFGAQNRIATATVTYAAIVPGVTVDPASLTFTAKQNIAVEGKTFTLEGANLSSGLTLAASEGFTVSPTSFTAEAAMAEGGVEVTVTPATPTTTTTPVEGTVTISGGGLASNVVVNLSMAVTPTYAVAVAVNDNTMGSATINGGTAAIYVDDDDVITLVATPAAGHEFVNWTVTDEGILLDNSNSASTTAIAGASGTITANFQAQGCTGLAAPTLNGAVAVTYNSATINWNAVANAEMYVVNITQGTTTVGTADDLTDETNYDIANLDANTTYHYAIMAMGDGSTYCDENNALLEGNFTTADYPLVAVTYSENGNLVSGGNKQIMTAFALPTEVSNTCSKQFVGWTTKSDFADGDESLASYYAKGAEFTIESNAAVMLYAVYADVTGGGTSTTNISYSGNTGNLEESVNVAATLGLDANSWTVIAAKGSASNNVGVNQAGDIRLYYNVNGSNTLTITAPQTITSVALTFTGDNYKNAWVKVENETVTLTDGVYPINNTTFVIGNANTSNVQVRISNIAVNFASAGTASNYSITCTEQVDAPTFTIEAGTYYAAQSIEIETIDGATVYYTTDGSTPSNTNGTEYTAAISLNERATTTIKAIAVKAGMENSEVAEAEYNINLPYTFAEFAALEKENNKEYAVMGIVSSKNASLNGSNLTYAISADGSTDDEISCYRGLKLNKATFESVDDINLGDNVTVVGTWSTEYSNLNANNWMLAYTARVHQSYAIAGELTNSAFNVGDAFDATILNNLYVVETFTNGYVEAVEGATLNAGDKTEWTAGETTLTVYAKLGDEVLTNKDFAVTVSDATLVSIALKADDADYQTKTSYYEGQTLVLPTIVATLSDESTIEALATYVSGFDNTTAGVQIVTVSFERGGITETTTYNVTIIQVFNNEDAPHTVADAKAMIEASAYQQKNSSTDYMWVRGIVVSAPNSSSTYTISDDGTSTDVITVWQGKYFSSSVNAYNHVKAGDKVILKGTIVNYDGTKPELTSSQVVYQLREAWLDVDNVDNFEVGTADLAQADLNIDTESNGVITLVSENENVVTIVDGKLHAVAPGTVNVTANMAATANDAALNYTAVSTTFSVTVIAAQTRYAVTFAANGGEGNAPVKEDQLEGATFNLPANTYTYAGHKFAGWSDGTNTYGAGAEYTMPAEAVTFTAQWTEIPYYAGVYTSNVPFAWTGESGENNSKVVINSTEYNAQKVGSSSKTGSVTVTVPYGTHTLHFHAVAWNGKSVTITASGVNNMNVSSFALTADGGFSGSTTYDLQNDPTDQYFVMTFDATTEVETTITFSYDENASNDKRFLMYGINQEGGVERALDHIEIGGSASQTTYEDGDLFNPAGLTVSAVYNIGEPEDITNDVTWSFNPSILTEGTTSVTATATYGEQTDDINVPVTVTASTHAYTTREVVFVVKSGDYYFAMGQDNTGSYLNAVPVEDVFNGKIVNMPVADRAAITWILREYPNGETAIMTQNGKFLNGAASGPNLTLSDTEVMWTWDGENGCYNEVESPTTRTFLYQAGTVNKFRFYNKSSINVTPYSSAPMLLTEYVDGTIEVLRDGLTAGKIGTVCWNKQLVEVEGAVLYKPEYKVEDNKGVGFIEVTTTEAGKPYVFQAEGETIRGLVVGDAVAVAGTNNGLHGTFTDNTTVPESNGYIFYENKIRPASNNYVNANRAYLVMDEVVDLRVGGGDAPARRRLVIGRPMDTPTELDTMTANDKATKVLMNGQIYIIRDGKWFDVTGQEVKTVR